MIIGISGITLNHRAGLLVMLGPVFPIGYVSLIIALDSIFLPIGK